MDFKVGDHIIANKFKDPFNRAGLYHKHDKDLGNIDLIVKDCTGVIQRLEIKVRIKDIVASVLWDKQVFKYERDEGGQKADGYVMVDIFEASINTCYLNIDIQKNRNDKLEKIGI